MFEVSLKIRIFWDTYWSIQDKILLPYIVNSQPFYHQKKPPPFSPETVKNIENVFCNLIIVFFSQCKLAWSVAKFQNETLGVIDWWLISFCICISSVVLSCCQRDVKEAYGELT
jgi:hypothetical protein